MAFSTIGGASTGGSAETPSGGAGSSGHEGVDDQSSSNDDQITIKDGEVVINDDSDDLDFRVESNGNANMLVVDGGTNRVGVGGAPSASTLEVVGDGTDGQELFGVYEGTSARLAVEGDFNTSGNPIIVKSSSGTIGSIFTTTTPRKVNIGGTSEPGAMFEITGDSSDGQELLAFTEGGNDRLSFQCDFGSAGNPVTIKSDVINPIMKWETTTGNIGVGVSPATPAEKLVVDGAVALKSQGSAPSATSGYAKLYSASSLDSDIVFLLHGQGSDDDADPEDFVDSSSNELVPSAVVGNCVIDTSQYTIGGSSSIYFPGATDHLTYADSEAWTFPGDFTIDFFCRFETTVPNVAVILGATANSGEVWRIQRYEGGGVWQFSAGSGFSPHYSFTSSVSADTWYHIAVTRSNGTIRFFQAGTQIGSDTAANTTTLNNPGLYVGRDHTAVESMDGWLQEIRITNNKALWTSNFTPPTTASGSSAELYTLDAAGYATKISPHSSEGEWEFYSKNQKTGKTVRINMEEVVRDLGQLTGKNYIKDE
tara:strand:+ start:22948 stop:24561 length:1614 start_codon:yes stop_codon:yes gene_type:complete